MDSLKKVSVQTVWQLIGKAVTSLSTLIILSLVSRKFGESGTGVFTLAVTYLSFFYLAADFGFNAHLLPYIQSDIGVWRKLFGLRIVWSIFLILLALIIAGFLPVNTPLFAKSVDMAVLAVLGSAIFVTANAIFQSKLRYDLSIIASSVGAIATTLFIFIFLKFNSIPSLLTAHLLGWFFCGVLALYLVTKFAEIRPQFDLSFIKKTLKDTLPISLTLILNVVYFRSDTFILTAQKPLNDVGTYNLAYQIFQSVLVIPTFIMNGFYPILLANLKTNKFKFLAEIKKAFFILLLLALLGIGATQIISPLFIKIIAGSKGFFNSHIALDILSVSFPAYFCSALLMWVMVSLKKYKQMVLIYIAGLILNICLNLIFIPKYSYFASSWITGISEYLILILQIFILIPILNRL